MEHSVRIRSKERLKVHIVLVLLLFAGIVLMLSADSFAAASPDATGRINASGGAYLRK
jgi:hypothetical protein